MITGRTNRCRCHSWRCAGTCRSMSGSTASPHPGVSDPVFDPVSDPACDREGGGLLPGWDMDLLPCAVLCRVGTVGSHRLRLSASPTAIAPEPRTLAKHRPWADPTYLASASDLRV